MKLFQLNILTKANAKRLVVVSNDNILIACLSICDFLFKIYCITIFYSWLIDAYKAFELLGVKMEGSLLIGMMMSSLEGTDSIRPSKRIFHYKSIERWVDFFWKLLETSGNISVFIILIVVVWIGELWFCIDCKLGITRLQHWLHILQQINRMKWTIYWPGCLRKGTNSILMLWRFYWVSLDANLLCSVGFWQNFLTLFIWLITCR